MEVTILENIPFTLDVDQLMRKLRLAKDSEYSGRVLSLAREAGQIAKPKAMYKPAYIEAKGDDFVVADGVKLVSRVLRVNIGEAGRLFPYLATCGREIAEWAGTMTDMFDTFVADVIQDTARKTALDAVISRIDGSYQLENASRMNPGSLPDWPLGEQRKLFAILGNQHRRIGMELTDSLMMLPVKSVSGIRFSAVRTFINCQLCPRQNCPSRLAPWEKDRISEEYGLKD